MNLCLIIYNFLLTCLFVFLFPLIFLRIKIEKVNKNYKFWIHCASLGEVKIALRLIQNIVREINVKPSDIILTTTTLTAKKIAKSVHKDTYLFPVDYYFVTRIFVRKVKPRILIILETELWPNYIFLVKNYGGKIFLLNGRISHNTFVFLNVFKCLFSSVLDKIDYFLVREKIDFLRFKNLGVNLDKLIITGNMKYDDIDLNENLGLSRQHLGLDNNIFVVTFGSIREGEEKIVVKIIDKFKNDRKIKFILAPRHLTLISKIVKLLKRYKIKYSFITSAKQTDQLQCLIVNTYGELKKIYSISDIVVVCGTLLPYGGQNIIEPASLGKMVVFGPYIANFLEPATVLLTNNAAVQLQNISELENIIRNCSQNREVVERYGNEARNVVKSLQGVTEKNVKFISKFLYLQ